MVVSVAETKTAVCFSVCGVLAVVRVGVACLARAFGSSCCTLMLLLLLLLLLLVCGSCCRYCAAAAVVVADNALTANAAN